MSWRALMIGFLAGLFISAWTFYNDMVLKQTRLIGSALPIFVFGGIVFWVMVINPLLGAGRLRWMFRPGEVAVAAAVALSACAFPGQGFFQYFTLAVGTPGHLSLTRPSWQGTQVTSYVPGGSSRLGLGHVADWDAFRFAVRDQRDEPTSVGGRLWTVASAYDRTRWRRGWEADRLSLEQQEGLLDRVNAALADPRFLPELESDVTASRRVAAGRDWLVTQMPEVIRPPPRGRQPVLLGGAYDERIVGELQMGLHTGQLFPVRHVPWGAWVEPTWVWLGGTLLLSLAAIALALIVHPQWAQREMLAFPIPQFVVTLSEREPGRWLPAVMCSRLFWIGFVTIASLHLVNGLHAWFPEVPQIDRRLDFSPLAVLFPNMSRVPFSEAVFAPTLYPTVLAFAFFIARSVSLSLGLTPIVFMFFGGLLISQGVSVGYDRYNPTPTNFLRFGAYLAMVMMIIYSGRLYYLQVLRGGLGLSAAKEVTSTARWAARLLVGLAVAGGVCYWAAGLSPMMASILVLLVLGTWLVLARITSETGMFLLAGPFVPLGILPAIFGDAAMGPTQLILLGIIGFILLGDAKESLMTFVVNGLEMARRLDQGVRRVGLRLVAPIATMVVVGAMVALVASVSLIYEHGTSSGPYWNAAMHGSARSFDQGAQLLGDLAALGTLTESVGMNDWDRLKNVTPDWTLLGWAVLGAALLTVAAVARLRWPWWPIHPVMFLVIGTWGISMFWASFLLGWVIKTCLIGVAGARGYTIVRPLMVGVIAGELLTGVGWMGVGSLYSLITGRPPESYSIFPV